MKTKPKKPSPSLENFRRNLRIAMNWRGFSIRKLGKEINVSYAFLSNLLAGKAAPSVEMCEKIAHHFALEITDFFVKPKVFSDNFAE